MAAAAEALEAIAADPEPDFFLQMEWKLRVAFAVRCTLSAGTNPASPASFDLDCFAVALAFTAGFGIFSTDYIYLREAHTRTRNLDSIAACLSRNRCSVHAGLL